MLKRLVTLITLAGLSAFPSVVGAQDRLSDLLVDLIQSDIILAPPQVGQSHAAHFVPGSDQRLAPYLFNQQLLSQLATVPLGSSSGGFSYSFDTGAGTFTRTTQSFGPTFAERALTNGKGRLTFGGNFQYSRYSSFEGKNLRNGDVKFYLRHLAIAGLFFEGDLVEAALKLKLSSNTTTIFSSYGITDTWDVAVAVPLVSVTMDATADATVLRLATGPTSPIHVFPNGTDKQSFNKSGSAFGVGDVLIRNKYRVLSRAGGGIAGNLDIRLPTGEAADLLGTGTLGVNASFIGSWVQGSLAPHFNVGYSAAGDSNVINVPNEFVYRLGTEYVVSPRTTLSFDLFGRSLLDAGRLRYADTTWTYSSANGTRGSTTLNELTSAEGTLNISSLALGGKFNVSGNMLMSANLIVALTSAGVTARVTPVVGLEYSF